MRTPVVRTAKDGPRLYDWLERLDAEAKDLPKARSWLHYPYFMFARYPRLQPRLLLGDARTRLHLKAGKEAFETSLREWRQKVEQDPDRKCILGNLSDDEKRQLAALIFDTVVKIEEYRWGLGWHKRLRKLASERPRRERMLKRKFSNVHRRLDEIVKSPVYRIARGKINRVRQAVADLDDYRSALDPLLGARRPPQDELPRPEEIALTDFEGLLTKPEFHPIPTDPVASCMVQLYWFFRRGCRVSGNDSEVRVALIRNSFWTKLGESPVSLRPTYKSAESAGCPAVDAAVRRFHPVTAQ